MTRPGQTSANPAEGPVSPGSPSVGSPIATEVSVESSGDTVTPHLAVKTSARRGPPARVWRSAQAFPKARRVLKRREFLRIQHQGLRIYSDHLIFQFLPGRGPVVRLGLTVSRKVGNAVVRNRIKRWLREVFRRLPPEQLAGRRPFDLVVTPKRDVGEITFAHVASELVASLHRYVHHAPNRPASGRAGRDKGAPVQRGAEGSRGPRTPPREPGR